MQDVKSSLIQPCFVNLWEPKLQESRYTKLRLHPGGQRPHGFSTSLRRAHQLQVTVSCVPRPSSFRMPTVEMIYTSDRYLILCTIDINQLSTSAIIYLRYPIRKPWCFHATKRCGSISKPKHRHRQQLLDAVGGWIEADQSAGGKWLDLVKDPIGPGFLGRFRNHKC